MSPSPPTRLDGELYASAQLVGAVMSRSAAQQIAHWARIGREVEAADGVSQREIAEVLVGRRAYDSLSAKEQAAVRVEWEERMTARREALDLEAAFTEEGRTWVELDDDGNVVRRKPGASKKRKPRAASAVAPPARRAGAG